MRAHLFSRLQNQRLVVYVLVILVVVFGGILAYSYFEYANDIAVTIHGNVRVPNGYGNPYELELATNFPELPPGSVYSNTLLFPENYTSLYSLIVVSGHRYNIFVTVEAMGKRAPPNCGEVFAHLLVGCTVCPAPAIEVPFGSSDLDMDITVSCPGP